MLFKGLKRLVVSIKIATMIAFALLIGSTGVLTKGLLMHHTNSDKNGNHGSSGDGNNANSKKSIELEGELYFNDMFDQIDKFDID